MGGSRVGHDGCLFLRVRAGGGGIEIVAYICGAVRSIGLVVGEDDVLSFELPQVFSIFIKNNMAGAPRSKL